MNFGLIERAGFLFQGTGFFVILVDGGRWTVDGGRWTGCKLLKISVLKNVNRQNLLLESKHPLATFAPVRWNPSSGFQTRYFSLSKPELGFRHTKSTSIEL
jgi:hypothetical protein